MSFLDSFDPSLEYSDYLSFNGNDDLNQKIDALINSAEKYIPKDQKIRLTYEPIIIVKSIYDPIGIEIGSIGWKYSPYPPTNNNTSVLYNRLNAYFQKLWKKPLPIEFKWKYNWI